MSAHLGPRVSALLDGQLSAEETERAWQHVWSCYVCRDLVEREGWVKTRLAGAGLEPGPAPDSLKGSLMRGATGLPPGEALLGLGGGRRQRSSPRRVVGFAALGSGAVGAAVVGVLALGTAPADTPSFDRRTPPPSTTSPAGPVTVRHARPGQ